MTPQQYLECTRGYLEFLDIMVDSARVDSGTTVQELTALIQHREFTANVLESFYEALHG